MNVNWGVSRATYPRLGLQGTVAFARPVTVNKQHGLLLLCMAEDDAQVRSKVKNFRNLGAQVLSLLRNREMSRSHRLFTDRRFCATAIFSRPHTGEALI